MWVGRVPYGPRQFCKVSQSERDDSGQCHVLHTVVPRYEREAHCGDLRQQAKPALRVRHTLQHGCPAEVGYGQGFGDEQRVFALEVRQRQHATEVVTVQVSITGELQPSVLTFEEVPQVLEAGERALDKRPGCLVAPCLYQSAFGDVDELHVPQFFDEVHAVLELLERPLEARPRALHIIQARAGGDAGAVAHLAQPQLPSGAHRCLRPRQTPPVTGESRSAL
jgi:hypothetical protein